MIIKQKIVKHVSLTAHPAGCARDVRDQISWAVQACAGRVSGYEPAEKDKLPKRVLIIGGSTGYGLATRIVSTFCGGADTLQVSFERDPTEKKCATPGWYNTKAFEKEAAAAGFKAASVFGDAFSHEIKQQTLDLLEEMMGKVDLVVYSLASPMRRDPDTGETYASVIKPIVKPYQAKTIDVFSGVMSQVTVNPASEEQVKQTVKVMGGEDWELWIDALLKRNLLTEGAVSAAFSYIGPELTFPIYREGSLGKAKEHLERSAQTITEKLGSLHGSAFVSVNKALVTRASSVIPVVPLYITILYKIMKDKDLHEGCIAQMYRFMTQHLYTKGSVPVDDAGRIRLDDWEMREDVQSQVNSSWNAIRQENLLEFADLDGFRKEYERIHGFGIPGIDYEKDVDPRQVN
jgi:enoyl-[acyl-carrier protein] reductase/trans-2-enoyl-CoA reductase (NAD+)